jgi:hypothetical protein
MPPVVAIISAVNAYLAAHAIIAAVVGAVLSAGVSLAANALFTSKPKKAAFGSVSNLSREIIENKKSTVEFIPIVYGQHRVGGIQVYEEVSSSYLYLVVVFCEGTISAVDTIYIDGVAATDSRFSGLVDAYTFLGADDQSVTGWTHAIGSGPADFISAGAPGWTANHRLLGCAGVALRLNKNTDVFPRIPQVTGIVNGRKVYDPRDLTTKYTTNPALCIRDYYTNTRFGAKIASSRLDDDSWTDAANFFETTTDYGNGTQSRFKMNGIVDTSQRVWDNIEDLMRSCNSLPKRVNGKHGILPLKSETVGFNFTDDNVVGGISVERLGKRFKKNKINAQFINPDNNWQADLYVVSDATYKAQDNNIDLTNELELRHVTDWYQTSHIARIALRQSRLEEKYNFTASHEALKCEIGDVVDLTHSVYGFSGKQMRVTSITIEPNGTIGIGAEEYDSSVYTVSTANAPNAGSTTSFGSPFDIDAPGTPSVSETFTTNSAGFVVNVATLSWAAPASAQVSKYIVEYKLSSSSDWIKAGEPQTTTFSISDIVAGTYDFAVSAVNTIGRISDRASRTSVSIVNNTDTPADVTGFSHEFTSDNQIVLRWDENSDVTVGGGYRIKVSNKTSGAAWSDFPQMNVLIDGRETTATLGLLEGTYMMKAENLAGVQSENAVTIPVNLPDHDEWVNVASVTESTAFAGTHTQTELSTGTLTLTATTSGGYYTSGNYVYANQMDFGGKFAFRLTRVSSGTLSNTAANWDSFTGNIDDYTTVLIDDMAGRSTVDVKHWFATSTQSSTGPFGDHQRLQMAEGVARYLKFKTTIDTESNTENTNISELAVYAWMKRRAESNWNVSASSTGATVTFAAPFYTTPAISVFPFNGTAGQYVTAATSQASRTGFEVSYFTSSGGQTSGKFSYAAIGYGKEIV